MSSSARDMLDRLCADLAIDERENRLVPLIAAGTAPLGVIGAFAAEEHHVVGSDRRSFLFLAARSAGPVADFYIRLGQGESLALARLSALAEAAGMDEAELRGYRPLAGCQAYPAYLAWLALNGDPVEVAIALAANLATWRGYCATVGQARRNEYGFDDDACAFFDLFAEPEPDADDVVLAVIDAALDEGRTLPHVDRYGGLLRSYELMFWNTLADPGAG